MEKRILFRFDEIVRINITCDACKTIHSVSGSDDWEEEMNDDFVLNCRQCSEHYHTVKPILRQATEDTG